MIRKTIDCMTNGKELVSDITYDSFMTFNKREPGVAGQVLQNILIRECR